MNYMCRAINLAQRGQYTVSPNPMVGCVIEKNDVIVGEGWHRGYGFPHAEIEALKIADLKAAGANLHVNLEPCCHFGKTPPCVDAIIKAKIKTVHVAIIDPNPLVNGAGIKKLRDAGINVFIGNEAEAATMLNEKFIHFIKTKKPFVVAKWAMTLDGKIATKTGNSKWITSEIARTHVHQLRQSLDAILVGADTVITDDPELTVKLANKISPTTKQPLRIVLDAKGRTPLNAKVYSYNNHCKTVVVTTTEASEAWCNTLKQNGVEVLVFEVNQTYKIDLNKLLLVLGKKQVSSLLVEGGAQTLTGFFERKLINKIYTYIAPKIVGGKNSISPISDLKIYEMVNALPLSFKETEVFGDDRLLVSYPEWGR